MPEVRPNFVGIGVPRAGTTWLHEYVNSHPQAYTTRSRKEVHYFDREYTRDESWYLKYFSNCTCEHRALGEFTPHYFYDTACIDRIKKFGIKKVILTIRDPVDRLWSNYQYKRRQDGFSGNVEEFLSEYPEMVSWSSYNTHLGPWLDQFGDGLCILVYEKVTKNHLELAQTLGTFLELSLIHI